MWGGIISHRSQVCVHVGGNYFTQISGVCVCVGGGGEFFHTDLRCVWGEVFRTDLRGVCVGGETWIVVNTT